MEILNSNIVIGKYYFDFVADMEIVTSWQEQTQKGTIVLPYNLEIDSRKLKTEIKKGDKVVVKIGYGDRLNTVFTGYVARVRPSIPIVIEVEDEMWRLKQITVNDKATNETLRSFLERILPAYTIDCFDIDIPRFNAVKITASQLLNQLKNDYGFYSFFRNGVLVVGKQYDAEKHAIGVTKLQYNIIDDYLEYMSKDDVKLKVTAISNLASGEKIEVELGDPDGEGRTLNFYNLPKSELTKVAENEMSRLTYDGYRGTVTLFGEPFVTTGDVLEIQNDEESDKTGRYWIDGVTYNFGTDGYRQIVKLGART
jgi:hypothetical protein